MRQKAGEEPGNEATNIPVITTFVFCTCIFCYKIMQYDIVLVQIVAVLPILIPVQIAFIITVDGRITGLRMIEYRLH